MPAIDMLTHLLAFGAGTVVGIFAMILVVASIKPNLPW